VYTLTWTMVDFDRLLWVIPDHKASRTARDPRPRVIAMNAEVAAVLRRRLGEQGGEGHVFRNAAGRPWTKDALALRMRRLRERAGVGADERGERFVLYTNRHTFLTEAAVDPTISEAVLSEMAGHTDPRTTRRYTHLRREVVGDAGRRVADRLSGTAPA
jgi:integrase